jgi:hypothetical protein
VSNVCELGDFDGDGRSSSSSSSMLPTKFKQRTCFLETALAMLESHSHLSCSQVAASLSLSLFSLLIETLHI